MKIISFPHYTCGGLLCDILNDTFSKAEDNGGIGNHRHNQGKIGDSDSVYTDFDFADLEKQLKQLGTEQWIGTHCWLGQVSLGMFERIINVTTLTHRSKIYRWVRAYHHHYLKSQPWQNLSGIAQIDKQRETAKNYLKPFDPIVDHRVQNLEFAEVVECSAAFTNLLPGNFQRHFERWRRINVFLYDPLLWNSPAVHRFYEAEYENGLRQRYIYD